MTNEDPSVAPAGGGGGRTPRQGSGGSPVGSTLSIVLAVIAVVAGFLILRNITDDGGGSGDAGGSSTGEPVSTNSITTSTFDVGNTSTTTTTTIPRTVEGATVVVGNGNSVGGSAGRMSKTLELVGYTMGDPTNASVKLDDTIVYYDPSVTSAEAVALSVGIDMGCVDVLVVTTPAPTDSGSLGDANVLVVLGNNQVDKTIEELAADCVAVVEAPAVSGSEEEIIAPTSSEG